MSRLVNKYKPLLTEITNVTVGRTIVELSNNCSLEECNFGNLIADSYVYYVRNFGFNINFCRLKKKLVRKAYSIDSGKFSFSNQRRQRGYNVSTHMFRVNLYCVVETKITIHYVINYSKYFKF